MRQTWLKVVLLFISSGKGGRCWLIDWDWIYAKEEDLHVDPTRRWGARGSVCVCECACESLIQFPRSIHFPNREEEKEDLNKEALRKRRNNVAVEKSPTTTTRLAWPGLA